jgi:hypothetical protein
MLISLILLLALWFLDSLPKSVRHRAVGTAVDNKVVIGPCELFHTREACVDLQRGNSKSGGSNGSRRS